MRKVLILTDLKGWHYDQLARSFNKFGILLESACLDQLSIRILNDRTRLYLKDKELTGFTDVFVRHVPGGTLEQVVVNLNILKVFERMDINVMNSSDNIETTVDKSLTSIMLNSANILTPNTWIFRDINEAKEGASILLKKHSLIYKPLFGSQGDNIVKINDIEDFDKFVNDTRIYYLQEFIETLPSHDYRILVIKKGDDYLTYTMARYGNSYVNNYSKGGKCLPVEIDDDLKSIAINAAKVIDIPFCGVDLIKSNNKIYVIEINSIPAWRGMQSINEENISDNIVSSFLDGDGKKFRVSIHK